ncbi:hypothetical protein BM734_18425 [Bacillus velezensis]|nr:hypothetical protein [Bacillus amyloliquefaciens]OOH99521.1 hypothetical protein BM734_18425 [Bacillus velezensis]
MLFPRDRITNFFAALSEGVIKKVVVMNTNRLWRADNAQVMIKRQLMKDSAGVSSIEQPIYSFTTEIQMTFYLME